MESLDDVIAFLERSYPESYPNEPIGGGNPYWRCSACGRSDPEINGRLEKHFSHCEWVEGHKAVLVLKKIKEKGDGSK